MNVRGRRQVRVLVIEDHVEMAEAVAVGLRRAHMAVDVAFDGAVASSGRYSTTTT